jgi:hypothetical protein
MSTCQLPEYFIPLKPILQNKGIFLSLYENAISWPHQPVDWREATTPRNLGVALNGCGLLRLDGPGTRIVPAGYQHLRMRNLVERYIAEHLQTNFKGLGAEARELPDRVCLPAKIP